MIELDDAFESQRDIGNAFSRQTSFFVDLKNRRVQNTSECHMQIVETVSRSNNPLQLGHSKRLREKPTYVLRCSSQESSSISVSLLFVLLRILCHDLIFSRSKEPT